MRKQLGYSTKFLYLIQNLILQSQKHLEAASHKFSHNLGQGLSDRTGDFNPIKSIMVDSLEGFSVWF